MIAIALALCALFLIGRTAYDVSLDLTRTRVVVGERAVGALTLANRGSRAILPSRVVLPVGAGRGVFGVRRLAAGEAAEELFAIPTQKRGVVEVGPVSVVRGDPLGLFERVHRRDEPVDLFVHPRTVLFEGQSLGFSATSRACRPRISPPTTSRSTPCASTSPATTCATCTGGPRRARAP